MKYKIIDQLKYEPCDVTLNELIKITEKSRPEFQLATIKQEQAKQNVKLVKKAWFPSFTVQGQFEVGGRHPDSNYGYTFGAYINFPTVNGMLIKHQLREAKALYSKEQANALNTINNIYLEVQNAYYNFDEMKNKIPVAYLSMKHAKENYELSEGRYKVGVGDFVEFQNAQSEYANAKLAYYKVIYEYNSSKANMEKSIGRNIVSGVVNLDINN